MALSCQNLLLSLALLPAWAGWRWICYEMTVTKGKLATRTLSIATALMPLLKGYAPFADQGYLFPGRWGRSHLHPDSAEQLLRAACQRVHLEGVSTHSFRRTALTRLSAAGVPLRVVQALSGHKTLSALQRYLEVGEDEVERAIAALVF